MAKSELPTKNGNENKSRDANLREAKRLNWITGLGVLMALGSLVILGISISQNKETFEAGQRAWVGVAKFEFEPLTVGSEPAVNISFKNLGPTVAREVSEITLLGNISAQPGRTFEASGSEDQIHSAVELFRPTQEKLQFGWRRDVIPQGSDIEETTKAAPALTSEMLTSLLNKQSLLVAIGKLKYTDIFGKEHLTRFCGYLDVASGKATQCGDLDNMN